MSSLPEPSYEIDEETFKYAISIFANCYNPTSNVFEKKDFRELEEIRNEKIEEINKACEIEIISGFTSTALGDEYLYQSDRDDQLNLMGLVANQKDNYLKCGIYENKKFNWDYKIHTIDQLKNVLADGAEYKLKILTKANILKNNINNSIPLEEIDRIIW